MSFAGRRPGAVVDIDPQETRKPLSNSAIRVRIGSFLRFACGAKGAPAERRAEGGGQSAEGGGQRADGGWRMAITAFALRPPPSALPPPPSALCPLKRAPRRPPLSQNRFPRRSTG